MLLFALKLQKVIHRCVLVFKFRSDLFCCLPDNHIGSAYSQSRIIIHFRNNIRRTTTRAYIPTKYVDIYILSMRFL